MNLLRLLCFVTLLLPSGPMLAQLEVEPVVQFGHPGHVITQIVLSPDNEIMATGDGEFVKLWDLSSGLELRSFHDSKGLSGIVFSGDGNRVSYFTSEYYYTRSVLTGEVTSRVSLEEYMQELGALSPRSSSLGAINTDSLMNEYLKVRYSTDRSLRSELKGDVIEITRTNNGELISEIPVLPSPPPSNDFSSVMNVSYLFHDMKFSPDNKRFLLDTALYVVQSGEEVFRFTPDSLNLRINSIAFLPNSSDAVICSRVLIPKDQRKPPAEIKISSLANISEYLFKVSNLSTEPGESVIFIDGEKGVVIDSGVALGVTNSRFSKNGKFFFTGHIDRTIQVWDLSTKTSKFTLDTKTEKVKPEDNPEFSFDFSGIGSLEESSDGRFLIVGSSGNDISEQLTMWNFRNGEKVKSFGAAVPPISVEVIPTMSDSLILHEYEEFLLPEKMIRKRSYGPHRILSLTNGKAPALFPKFDSIYRSSNLAFYAAKSSPNEPFKIYSSLYNEEISVLERSSSTFNKVIFSNQGAYLAGAAGSVIKVWNTQSGELIHTFEEKRKRFSLRPKLELAYLMFDPSDRYLMCTYSPQSFRFYDLTSGELTWSKNPSLGHTTTGLIKEVSSIGGSSATDNRSSDKDEKPTKGLLGSKRQGISNRLSGIKNTVRVINRGANFLSLLFKDYYDLDVSPDGTLFAGWRDDYGSVAFFKTDKKKPLKVIKEMRVVVNNLVMKQLDVGQDEAEGQFIRSYLQQKLAFRPMTAISPDWTRVAVKTNQKETKKKKEEKRIRVEYLNKKQKKDKLFFADSEDFGANLTFSPDAKMLAATSDSRNEIRIWDANTGRVMKTLEGHSGKVAFTNNNKTLISSGWDRQVKVWDLEKDSVVYSFIAIKGENDYLTLLPSGYYATSRKDSRAVAFAYGKDAYPFDQFDIQFNRPDLVLAKLARSIETEDRSAPNKKLVEAYHRSYQKRLEKLGFSEADFGSIVSLPVIAVAEHTATSASRNMKINVKATDSSGGLRWLVATIDGNPIFENGQQDIPQSAGGEYNLQLDLFLSEGENRLQVYAISTNGTSLKYNTTITYTGPPAPRRLHMVTLGTSEFQQAKYNLEYPVIDLVKFRDIYGQRAEEFAELKEYRLEGSNFTLAKFLELENQLANVGVDDEVVVFFSTHGLLDAKFDYYLATYDIDFDNPTDRGLSYEKIEKFLRKIKARNKLVFLDACHSGELDTKALKEALIKGREHGKINFKSVRSTGWENLPGQQSFDLMKELFVDLRNGTGATIIASASAVEFAYESEEWDNSAFTYCLLRALKEGVADTNQDGKITVSEIQQYLGYAVPRLTSEGQKPINRSENIYNNYSIWNLH